MQNKSMKMRILEFITVYSYAHNAVPSYREISAAVGLKSTSSVSRYIDQLKKERMLLPVNSRGQGIALPRKIELSGDGSQPQRVCLEVADGGTVLFDCDLEKMRNDVVSVSFTGIVDASQMRSRVGRVVNYRVDES